MLEKNAGDTKGVRWFETAVRYGTLLVGTVYATGFLVVTFYHAQYGITEFDLARPKVFIAGFWFVLMAGLGIVTVSRTYGLFGVGSSSAVAISALPSQQAYLNWALGFGAYPACVVVASFFSVVFGFPLKIKPYFLPIVVVWAVFSLVALPAVAKNFINHPKKSVALSFLYSLGVAVVAVLYWDRALAWCSGWLYFVGLGSALVYFGITNPKRVRTFEWEKLIPLLFTAVFVFAVKIYGRIAWYYGGGAPVPVIFTLASKTPVSESGSVALLLVEETEHGYFVLSLKDREKAYFLRRDLVTTVHFVKDEESLK